MRRNRLVPFLCALAVAALLPAAGAAQESSMRGTFTLNRQASDNVRAAIDAAVQRMSFVTRPIARGRLVRTNPMYERVNIEFDQRNVTVTLDNRRPIASPANGTPIKWTREDGEVFDLSTEWENGRLEQTFKAEDGQRLNVYSISPDGNTLTMNVTITSPRLPRPLTYKLVYNRAR